MFQETKVSNIVLVLKHRHTTLQCDCLEKEPGNPALSHIDPLQKNVRTIFTNPTKSHN